MGIKTGIFKNHSFMICLLLIMAIYLPVNYFGFVSMDDAELFERFHYNQAGIDFYGMFFRGSASRYYRPLLVLSFYLDSQIWGLSLKGYHLTNYVFHVLNAVLVYLISLRLFKHDRKASIYASLAMVFFGLNPLTCESVAWVSGRSDIAGAFFFLLAVNFYFIKKTYRYILTPLAVFLGMLCKENALAGIPIIVLMDFFINYTHNLSIKAVLKKAVLWSLIMAVPLIFYFFLRTNGWEHNSHTSFLTPENITVVNNWKKNFFPIIHIFPVIGFYMKKLVVPFPLNFAISQINVLLYSIVIIVFCILNIIWAIKRKFSFVLWSMILVASFIPALPVAFGEIAWMPFAERYLYLSASVASVCMAAGSRHFVEKGVISSQKRWIFLIVLIFIFSFATFNRVFVWKNSKTLWAETLDQNPDSSMVLFKYGQALGGKTKIWAYQKAIANSEHFKFKDITLLGIAEYEISIKKYDKAIKDIEKALKIKNNFENLCQAAVIILSMETSNKNLQREYKTMALQYYQAAYKKRRSGFVLFKIGVLMKETNRTMEAMQIFEKVTINHPTSRYALYSGMQLKNYNMKKSQN